MYCFFCVLDRYLIGIHSRSPGHRVPWWVLIWIKRSPLVFLVFSVACFSVGLVLFSYSSQQACSFPCEHVEYPSILTPLQSHITCTITTVFTAFTSFGLAAVSTWFASERWAYTHHQGRKWLGDVLADATESFYRLRGMVITRHALIWSGERLKDAGNSLKRVPSITASFLTPHGDKAEDKDFAQGTLPLTNTPVPIPSMKHGDPESSQAVPTVGEKVLPTRFSSLEGPEAAVSPAPDTTTTTPKGKRRFATLVRSMIMMQSGTPGSPGTPPLSPFGPRRQRTTSSSGLDAVVKKPEPVTAVRGSRAAILTPKLKSLEATQDLAAHQALVRDLQFSPDGKFLATSRYTSTLSPTLTSH